MQYLLKSRWILYSQMNIYATHFLHFQISFLNFFLRYSFIHFKENVLEISVRFDNKNRLNLEKGIR